MSAFEPKVNSGSVLGVDTLEITGVCMSSCPSALCEFGNAPAQIFTKAKCSSKGIFCPIPSWPNVQAVPLHFWMNKTDSTSRLTSSTGNFEFKEDPYSNACGAQVNAPVIGMSSESGFFGDCAVRAMGEKCPGSGPVCSLLRTSSRDGELAVRRCERWR